LAILTLSAAQAAFGTTESVQLGRIVNAANARVKRVAGREFERGTYVYYASGENQSKVWLPERPVVSVTSVVVGGETVSPDLYTFDADTGVLGFNFSSPYTIVNKSLGTETPPRRGLISSFPRGFNNIVVTYVGGLESSDDRFALVQQVTLEVVRSLFLGQSDDKTITTLSIGQYSRTRMTGADIDSMIYGELGDLVAGVL
jgi:hypothetical protein